MEKKRTPTSEGLAGPYRGKNTLTCSAAYSAEVGNNHLIPLGCSIHLYPDECRLEIPSRGIDAKLLVTTSNHIPVNLAEFAGMEEPDYDVWTSKRGRESEETGTESEMAEGTEETITGPEQAPVKRTRKGAPRKPFSAESGFAIRAEKVAACSCKRIVSISGRMGKSLKGCRQGSRFAAS